MCITIDTVVYSGYGITMDGDLITGLQYHNITIYLSAEKEQAILVTIVILTDIVDIEEPPGVDLSSKNSVLSFKVSFTRSVFVKLFMIKSAPLDALKQSWHSKFH